MDRYSKVINKNLREIVLLKALPCIWGKCAFCDYIDDNDDNIAEINKIYSMSTGFNGKELYFMENGIKYKENYTGSIGKPDSSTVFAIGVNPRGTSDGTASSEARFNMKVYSVRIYNRCLTEDEINHNYEIDKARFGITE